MNAYKLGKICTLICLSKVQYESAEVFRETFFNKLIILVNLCKIEHAKVNS